MNGIGNTSWSFVDRESQFLTIMTELTNITSNTLHSSITQIMIWPNFDVILDTLQWLSFHRNSSNVIFEIFESVKAQNTLPTQKLKSYNYLCRRQKIYRFFENDAIPGISSSVESHIVVY